MSTRVHELAKELGMKSQELLDHILKEQLDVKPSPLASLDEAMVARIRASVGQPGSSSPTPSQAEPEPATKARPVSPPPPRADTPPPPAPRASHPESTPIQTATPVQPKAAPAASASGPAPELSKPPAAAQPRPDADEVRPSGLAPRPAGASGPLAGHTRPGQANPSQRGGPLAGHTHRGAPAGNPPPRQPQSPPPADSRGGGGSGGAAPLRQSDYIGPAGTRVSPPGSRPPVIGANTGIRRSGTPPQQGGGQRPTDQPRRDAGPRRSGPPLPPVASASAPPQQGRRPQQPSRPTEPAAKSQAPVVKYTPEELRRMMQAGQLGPGGPTAAQPARGQAPGAGGPRRSGTPLGAMPVADAEEEERKGKSTSGRPGGAADRDSRRQRRVERATAQPTRVSSPVDARALIDSVDADTRLARGARRAKAKGGTLIAPRKTEAEIEPPITVRSLSETIGIKANDIIRKLMALGNFVTINSTIENETAQMLSLEFGVELHLVNEKDVIDVFDDRFDRSETVDAANLQPRPPVITILGHVDHGKTSLLDKLRKANVVASETGGITQHIGAYQIEHEGKKITFVDTPGHEAFTAMRARGANVTDIVILVVAADDGVMPQTKEAIAHAKAAEVPVVVALNKIDLPNVDNSTNINKIYGELSQEGLHPSEWGGDVEVIKTSTMTGVGLTELLSTLEVIAELKELKADPTCLASGTCLEASLSEGRGVVATVLVQEGTLRVGDAVACGAAFGRVRALSNSLGQSIIDAPPSTPVEISGLDFVPGAGEKFGVLEDITRAREIAELRRDRTRGAGLIEPPALTLENVFTKVSEQKVKTLNLILKADVQGSLEALTKEFEKLENPEVPLRILLKAVGGITESDVLLADASQAIIIGFRVAPEDRAISLADEKKIDIRRYDIIYQVTDEVKKAIEGLLVPEIKEVHLGRAVVRQTFKISRTGNVAGCVVTQGQIERSAKVRLIREGREIYKGAIDALKRFKDDVKEVREGYECGIKISNYDDVKTDDVIEAYRVDVIRRTL